MPVRAQLIGQQFGRLKVVEFSSVVQGNSHWVCLCVCGAKIIAAGCNLTKGHTTSCGCFKLDNLKEIMTVHGHARGNARTTEYNCWATMIQRCTNPNSSAWPGYGAIGIKVCDRWLHSFPNFIADMGRKESLGLSIERVNGLGNYEPSNCIWATAKEQANNRRAPRRRTA